MSKQHTQDRNLLFISHANPADNDFAIWLGSRLTTMGYQIWVDLNDLEPGVKHWNEIETKIREETIKFLVVVSHASRAAEGVEKEINIAIGTENEFSLDNFIVQLKIDDLPYSQLPPVINNRFALSFGGDWGAGLSQLVEALENDNIAKICPDSQAFEHYSRAMQRQKVKIVSIDEPAYSSWLPIKLPEKLYVYNIRGRAKVAENKLLNEKFPAFSFSPGQLISFAEPDAVSFVISSRADNLCSIEVPTDAWINQGSISDLFVKKKDRRRAFSGLLNSSWRVALLERGFLEYELVNASAFFLPSSNNLELKQSYSDPIGRSTRPITLVGQSSKFSSYWHAAISAHAVLTPTPIYSTRLHVAFTDDGRTPIAVKQKALLMRKSFCKSFWNDRWRRIFFAMFAKLKEENSKFLIRTGGEESIEIKFPLTFQLPYSISIDLANQVDESEINDISYSDAIIDFPLDSESEILDTDEEW